MIDEFAFIDFDDRRVAGDVDFRFSVPGILPLCTTEIQKARTRRFKTKVVFLLTKTEIFHEQQHGTKTIAGMENRDHSHSTISKPSLNEGCCYALLFFVFALLSKRNQKSNIISHSQQLEVIPKPFLLNYKMVKTQDFSRLFESNAVEYCNSLLSKSLPNCTCNELKRRHLKNINEFDGFGYVLTDSGDCGKASTGDGLALIDLGDSLSSSPRQKHTTLSRSPEAKSRRVDRTATKYIVAEAFLGVGELAKQLHFDDIAEEQTKATEKMKQLGQSLESIRKRYREEYNDKSNPIGAAFLVTFCYKHKNEPKTKKSKRAKKLKRLKLFLENLLLDADSKTQPDSDLVELIEIAKHRRLFLVVLTNENAPNFTSNIMMMIQTNEDNRWTRVGSIVVVIFVICAGIYAYHKLSADIQNIQADVQNIQKNQENLTAVILKNQERFEERFANLTAVILKNQERFEERFEERFANLTAVTLKNQERFEERFANLTASKEPRNI